MKSSRIQGWLAIAMSAFACASVAQLSPSGELWKPEPPILQYSTIDGLSQSDILDVVQDPSGHLWLATHRGLNRYDGSEFLNFTKANGLLHNSVTAILATDSGQIWFSDINANLLVIDNNIVSEVVPIQNFQGRIITQLVQFGERLIIATQKSGLYSLDFDDLKSTPVLLTGKGENIRDVGVKNNELWLIQDTALLRWNGTIGAPFERMRENVVGSSIYDAQTHWLVTAEQEIGLWSEGAFTVEHRLLPGEKPENIIGGADKSVWVLSNDKLLQLYYSTDEHGVEHDKHRSIGDFPQVNKLFVDRENTLWIGGYAGLYRHLGSRFTHYKNEYSGNSKAVWAIAEDPAGNFYYGTTSTLLRHAADGEVVDYLALLGIKSGTVRDIVSTGNAILYASVFDVGLLSIDTLSDSVRVIAGTESFEILDLEIDSRGTLWMATVADGLVSVDTSDFTDVRQYKETINNDIFSLTVDPAGNVWYGVDSLGIGVLRLSADDYTHDFYGPKSGMDNLQFSQLLAVDVNKLWIVGEDGFLLYFDNGVVKDYTADSPMMDQNIYTVFVKEDGKLLLGGENGVSIFDPRTSESRSLSLLHGFLGVEVNVHTNYLDTEGFLWFGTINGPTRMNLKAELRDRIAIVPTIMSAKAESSQSMVVSGDALEFSENGVVFRFDAVSLLEPFSVEYSYRLVGYTSEWSTPDRSHSVNYSSLAPGKYRFEVRARYADGRWYQSEDAFNFTMLAPFYRTNWFVFLAIAVAALVLYLGIYLRTRGIDRQNQRLRSEVEERTRSLHIGRKELMQSNMRLVAEVEERKRVDVARAESEARFKVAFQSTPIGMALIDLRGNLLNSNLALRKMFLAPKDYGDETAQMGSLELIEDSDERARVAIGFKQLVKGEIDHFSNEHACQRFDGEVLHVHLYMTSIRDDDGKFKYCMAQLQDITESRRLTEALEYQANYDELSGLLNRRSFEKQLDRAYAQSVHAKIPSFLMFMDLDQFKVVNDTSGHGAGDEMLRQISELIKEQVRTNDTVGRLGGDEFGLILWNCPIHVAYRIAESIRAEVEQFQFRWGTNTYRVGMSIGAVTIDSALGSTAEIQQLADAACYHSKEHGRNRVHFLREEGESINEQRGEVRWIQRLHEAMDQNSFVLYGQFIEPVDPNSNEPERVEILLRMRDLKTRKIIPPGAFLPAAERYGLITKLDKWVVDNLLKMLWVHRSFGSKDRRYWVNLSGNSIGDKRFVDYLIDAIANCGLPRGMINFEITETAVIRNVGEAGRLMSALHEMGCQFALDDFGSGLSSFGYLKKLPVDYIKIDGMFVRDILTDDIDRVFVRSIIDIARTMGIKSIAEFVENDAILKAVGDLGVDYVQGFGVHRPEAVFADLSESKLLGPSPVYNQFEQSSAVGNEKMA